jgi:hypothetical protein
MLLHDDVVGDGEAKASALSGGFCREKGIEHLVLFTMMSWVMERPRPVPSPAGFVVKKGCRESIRRAPHAHLQNPIRARP